MSLLRRAYSYWLLIHPFPVAMVVAWSACIVAQMIALGSAIWLKSDLQFIAAAIILSLALVAISVAPYHRNPSSATLRGNFRLMAPSAVILTAGWLFALNSQGRGQASP